MKERCAVGVLVVILGLMYFVAHAQTSSKARDPSVGPLDKKLVDGQPQQEHGLTAARKQAAAHVYGAVLKDCSDCPEMVVVPTGTFQMGSANSELGHFDNEGPVHEVQVGYALAVGRFAVTRGQWRAFVEATGYDPPGCYLWDDSQNKWFLRFDKSWRAPGFFQNDNHPVVCVTWTSVNKYTEWLSRRTGKKYRLLSEAEYEYADRAGTTSVYPWGNNATEACRYANVDDQSRIRNGESLADAPDNLFQCDDGYPRTAPVGSFKPNAFGLYDMEGNVWSWTADCWNDSYNGAPTDGSSWNTGDCSRRVDRGGSWGTVQRGLRSAYRDGFTAAFAGTGLGFRLARTD